MSTVEIWVSAERTLLLDTLSAELDRQVTVSDFARGPYGKPTLPAHPDLHFNHSHAGGLFAVAISRDGPVGIDIERVREVREKQSICERYRFDPERFFEDWTRREAWVKARGTGIRELALPIPDTWHVETWIPAEGFVGAWAIEGGTARAIYRGSGVIRSM